MRKFLNEKILSDPDFYCLVYNLGISGNTTDHIVERFDFETNQRIGEKPEEVIIIFDFGGNDAAFIHSKNDLWVSEKKFEENTKKLIDLAKKYSSKIILIGGHPVDEKITDPVPWNKDVSCRNINIEKYKKIMKRVCGKESVFFVDLFNLLDINSDFEDGAHPNSKGHQKIFKVVKEALIKNKIII